MSTHIIVRDCLEALRKLPDESVHCVVTSPPYWGLRDYGIAGQLGLESSFQDYIAEMVVVFREVRRVLRKDGTLWLNMGDSYIGGGNGGGGSFAKDGIRCAEPGTNKNERPFWKKGRSQVQSLPSKNLVGMPWRLAFALQADGWYLRSDIIWHKPNPMPESVTDRPTKAHEYVFLMSKSERYYYDAEAIKEDVTGNAHSRGNGLNPKRKLGVPGMMRSNATFIANELVSSRNKRTVWTIPTAPFPEAHFATFPPALVEPCILAGCPKGGLVLDPFGGAGTTALIAARLGREAILIELNPQYAAMAERRLQAANNSVHMY
jgi:site-specific DNA-methyltransferase (adenine-specific)